jgi:altronate hydrolase
MGQEIFDALIEVASGRRTKSELFGMGGDEFIVWWLGITA